jgi:hypothetical protein
MTTDPTDTLAALTQLAADAQQRADAATPGPWAPDADGEWIGTTADHGIAVAQVYRMPPCADAEFIAAARSDVPALVSGLRQTTTALHAVLDLHDPASVAAGRCECYEDWPCSTVRTIAAVLRTHEQQTTPETRERERDRATAAEATRGSTDVLAPCGTQGPESSAHNPTVAAVVSALDGGEHR